MPRTSRSPFVLAAILLATAPAAIPCAEIPDPPEDPRLQQEIDATVDKGVDYLLKSVEETGWTPDPKFGTGYAALAVYALVKSDVSYLHPTVQKGIAVMEEFNFEKVYSVSLYLMAYDAIVHQIDEDAKLGESKGAGDRGQFLDRMKSALDWLLAARLKGQGVWNYQPPGKDREVLRYDHSNTQFAVLALGVAAERKLRVPAEVWDEIARHFIGVQETDGATVTARPIFHGPSRQLGAKEKVAGKARTPSEPGKTTARQDPIFGDESKKMRARGWKYIPEEVDIGGESGRRRQFSMVCAGLSSLLIAQRYIPGAAEGPRGEAFRTAIRDGYAWLVNALDGRRPGSDYYAFYSLEKVGDLGEVLAFGGFYWYEECGRAIVRYQKADGSFQDTYKTTDPAATRAATCLALLFLDRATDLGTRRPLVSITRAGGPAARSDDRQYWLYLPSVKTEVPVVRLFRLLRHRPGKKVMALAEEAVKVGDPLRVHEIVPLLAATAASSAYEPSKELAKKLLVAATGVQYDEPARYDAWATRFGEAIRIGRGGDRSDAGKAREMLRGDDGPILKAKVIWAVQRTGAKESMGDLIELLEDPDAGVREAAHGALTILSGQSIPFSPKASEKSRAEGLAAWRAWWAREKGKSQGEPGESKESGE